MTDVETTEAPSYHDVFITTKDIPRTSIFNLPFNIELACERVSGWTLWDTASGLMDSVKIAGEFEGDDKWLIMDVAGHVIVDSKNRKED